MMSGEPASSAAGGFAAWKLGGAILGIGVVASALGFIVLLPKTPREAALRALATMIGSALFGPLLVAAAHSQYPGLFDSGVNLAARFGVDPWTGMFVTAAPLLALAGLPVWWILGALARWFEVRKDKDIAQLWKEAKKGLGG